VHVVEGQHGGVGRVAVLLPHRPAVERGQAGGALRHAGKAAQPHEAVGRVQVAKLPHHGHAHGLLRVDERAVEQLDQRIALAGVQRVLAQLHHLAGDVADGHGGQKWRMWLHGWRWPG
jgi:hypothetical protein